MAWYKSGTVAVTNGSTTVTGTSTAWVDNTRVGDAFIGPDGLMYEITARASNTSLTIYPAYRSTTASGAAYMVGPLQGYLKTSADALSALAGSYGDAKDNITSHLSGGSSANGDGNKHPPATGTSNAGKYLRAGATAGEMSWATITPSDIDGLVALQSSVNAAQEAAAAAGSLAASINARTSNVDNTSDADKPISTAAQAALDLKANQSDVTNALALKANAADVSTSFSDMDAAKANVATTLAGYGITDAVGLGGVVTNLNTIALPAGSKCVYLAASTADGVPNSNTDWVVEHTQYSSTTAVQVARGAGTVSTYARILTSGAGNWVKYSSNSDIATSADITAGTAGKVIDAAALLSVHVRNGGNPGYLNLFNDYLIQCGTATLSGKGSSYVNGTITFAKAFVDSGPYVVVVPMGSSSSSSGLTLGCRVDSVSAAQFTAIIDNGGNSGSWGNMPSSIGISWIAVGH